MQKNIFGLAAAAIAVCALAASTGVTRAGSIPDPAGTTVSYNETFKLTRMSTTDGACAGGGGLANHCPIGPCTCTTFAGTGSGSAGHGNAQLLLTDDTGQAFGNCDTAYGDITVSGSKDFEFLSFRGGHCSNSLLNTINGTCDLALSSDGVFSELETNCGGPDADNTTFKIKGKALKQMQKD